MSNIFCEACGKKDGFMQDTENGELVCKHCGLVVSEDLNFEDKPHGKFNEQTGQLEVAQHGAYRTGMIHDYGMSTMVGQFLDLAKLTTEQRIQFYRLRRWQTKTRAVGSRDRNLIIALSFLIAMCDELTIPKSVQEYAAKTYRKALDARLVRGRTICRITAASLYFACRVHGVTRTFKYIAATNVLKSEGYTVRECELGIARDYRMMHQRLNLKTPIQTALPFVAKICSQLGLSSIVREFAAELLHEYSDKKLSAGKSQQGLAAAAAAAIYIACQRLGVKVTQMELASVAQVTEVTIRNRYKGIVEDLKIGEIDTT